MKRGHLPSRLFLPMALATLFFLSMTATSGTALAQDDDMMAQDDAVAMQQGDYVEVNGADIYYRRAGEGTPMVLIHGYPLSSELYAENIDALSQNYQVIALDLRGYGQSEAPGDAPEATIETYAEDVLAVMDELGIEQALIGGMSMGGPIVLEMHRQAPDRFLGLLLIDTIAAPANPAEAGLWTGMIEIVENEGMQALVPVLMNEMLTGETRMARPELVERMASIITAASEQAGVAGLQALAGREDYRPVLSEITVPTLVLVGLEDTVYPFEVSRRMSQAIPTAELAIIDGAAHAAVIERPEQASEAILEWAEGVQMGDMPMDAEMMMEDEMMEEDMR